MIALTTAEKKVKQFSFLPRKLTPHLVNRLSIISTLSKYFFKTDEFLETEDKRDLYKKNKS